MSALAVGDAAPDFDLAADGGGRVRLSDLSGKTVVLYLYPKDDTPGCTTEAKDFRDLYAQFGKADTVVFGISKDPMKSHDKFRAKYDLPFDLVSDAETGTAEQFGVWGEKSMYGRKYMGVERTTFLIGADGTIKAIWPKVKVDGHAAEVLKAAQGA